MTSSARHITRDAVVADLRAEAVLDRFNIKYRRTGGELRTRACPTCGERSRDSVTINANTGRWIDHAHGCSGDLLALVAALAGLDIDRDFPRVLEAAAEIAGVEPPTSIGATMGSTRAPARPVRDMQRIWNELDRRSIGGEKYLASRGFDPRELRAQNVVRFSQTGEIAVAVHSLVTGDIAGIQYRSITGKEFRTERGSALAGSALIGRIAELDRNGVDVAVVAEGVADSLAARLAFSGCAVFGAPGAEQLKTVAAAVAKRVKEIGGWMLLVSDDDDAGVAGGVAACDAALAAGLKLDRDFLLVDLGEHHDLADAWRAGWRWTWPA